jgi:hypothetical protein
MIYSFTHFGWANNKNKNGIRDNLTTTTVRPGGITGSETRVESWVRNNQTTDDEDARDAGGWRW